MPPDTPEQRNYAADMRVHIDNALTIRGTVPDRTIAENLVRTLDTTDPDLLHGWLHMQAVNLLRDTIATIERSRRGHARVVNGRHDFAAATSRAQAGDMGGIESFLNVRYVIDGARKPLSALTVSDLESVATDYEAQAAENALNAAFLRAVAKKLKSRRGAETVADLFTDEQLARMWHSMAAAA